MRFESVGLTEPDGVTIGDGVTTGADSFADAVCDTSVDDAVCVASGAGVGFADTADFSAADFKVGLLGGDAFDAFDIETFGFNEDVIPAAADGFIEGFGDSVGATDGVGLGAV